MEKARDIWRNKIRRARKPKLEEQDVRYMRALEADSDVNSIVQIKEQLRNFPNKVEIEQAQTVEELKEIWDNSLLGEVD
tara:strand:+ start:66 stop:302 length:237 start_codon:yes stop_codon:yes gene_type:complete